METKTLTTSLNDPIYNARTFRLLTLKEAVLRFPKKYRRLDNKMVRRLAIPGAYLKVMAESTGPVVTAEELWLLVRQINLTDRSKDWDNKHVGEVATMTQRSAHHGVEPRMLIYFRLPNVLDVQTSLRKM